MKGRFWPLAIVGLLAANAAIVAVTVKFAVQGQNGSIEDDYYQKAVHWDEHVAQQARNAALGWHAQITIAPPEGAHAKARAIVRLTDKSGQPIRGAAVKARFFHFAHADEAVTGLLSESAEGYAIDLPEIRAGVWNASIDVSVNNNRFTNDQDVHVVAVK